VTDEELSRAARHKKAPAGMVMQPGKMKEGVLKIYLERRAVLFDG